MELFPYVGLTSENIRVLGEEYTDYSDWAKEEAARKEQAARNAPKGGKGAGDWMDMFDSADASVRDGLKGDE